MQAQLILRGLLIPLMYVGTGFGTGFLLASLNAKFKNPKNPQVPQPNKTDLDKINKQDNEPNKNEIEKETS